MPTSPSSFSSRPPRVLVYLGATLPPDPSYGEAVRELGQALVRRGATLVFGGSREGTMTILADTVLQGGGQVIGVFPQSLPPEFLYPGLTQTIVTPDISQRKVKMLELADVVIAMPGSYGTWDELFDALERQKVERLHGRPVKPVGLLNLHGFYDGILVLLQRAQKEGFTTEEYADLLAEAPTVPALLDKLLG